MTTWSVAVTDEAGVLQYEVDGPHPVAALLSALRAARRDGWNATPSFSTHVRPARVPASNPKKPWWKP